MFVEEYGGLELHDVERATEEILLGLEITSSVISDGRIMIKLSYNGKLISDTILNIPNVGANKKKSTKIQRTVACLDSFDNSEEMEKIEPPEPPRRYRAFCGKENSK